MASGLAALLDDIAGIAKIAAASVDDVAGAAGKASVKAAGVVVDDTAVTPSYAVGFTPDRELPIVGRIALGSLRNKMFLLLPGALLLSAFAPWAVTPILMLGGAYLCFEATEKVLEAMGHGHHPHAHEIGDVHVEELALNSKELEKQKISGAIRTDLILSAEIMAIALASVSDKPLAIQAAALAVVGVLITLAVYGVVGFIVKMDDIGLHLAKSPRRAVAAFGRGLVKAMPPLLDGLTVIGTAAMLWVGGGIIVHGLEHFHLTPLPGWIEAGSHAVEGWPVVGPLAGWLVFAAGSAVVGAVVGLVVILLLKLVPKKRKAAPAA
jgi:predicted DNA repair protein MutK